MLSIDKELPVTRGHEYFTHPPKKRNGMKRERENFKA
jgi:hypothetical protein